MTASLTVDFIVVDIIRLTILSKPLTLQLSLTTPSTTTR